MMEKFVLRAVKTVLFIRLKCISVLRKNAVPFVVFQELNVGRWWLIFSHITVYITDYNVCMLVVSTIYEHTAVVAWIRQRLCHQQYCELQAPEQQTAKLGACMPSK